MNEKELKILKEYERYLTVKGVVTKNQYIATVKEYLEYLKEEEQSFDIVKRSIGISYRAFLVSNEAKTLSRLTINNKLNRLRSLYNFLIKRDYCYCNPFLKLEGLKTGISLPKNILSVADIGKLLGEFSVLNEYDYMARVIIELLYGSGLRISEAVGLKVSDVDFEKGIIYIKDGKDNGRIKKRPATEISLRLLKQYIKRKKIEAGYIFPQMKEGSIKCMLNNKLKRECERLELKVITTHSFRHSIATHILRGGAGIREVQEFLGHKRITSTEVYTRVVKEDLKNVIEKHHPREIEGN